MRLGLLIRLLNVLSKIKFRASSLLKVFCEFIFELNVLRRTFALHDAMFHHA